MPSRFEWITRIKDVEREFGAALLAVGRLIADARADPNVLAESELRHRDIWKLNEKLEGTYLVRLFAAFEAALRSYDRAWRNDPTREVAASVLIDSIGGRRGRRIADADREGAHAVREVRNSVAHGVDQASNQLTVAKARARLSTFLSRLPEEWD